MKRTVLFVSMILIGFVFAAEVALGQPKNNHAGIKLEISLILSNGEKISGKIIRVDKNRVFIKTINKSGNGKNITVFKANIAEIIPLSNGGEKYDTLDDAAKALAAGREFLKLNHPDLAKIAFDIAIQRNAKSCDTIHKIYTDADKKLPQEFKKTIPNNSRKAPLRLFVLPTPEQIENCMNKARRWGREMKKIAPKTHTIETKHFIIYSAWSRSNDKKLTDIYEKLYRALCKQFSIPKEHNIWIGKLPVFAFWKRHNFANFCADVVGRPTASSDLTAGFRWKDRSGEYMCVVLGPVKDGRKSKAAARKWFFELLVHESTHAFLSRYISSKRIASWLHEGIAETIASDLVPKSRAAQFLKQIHKHPNFMSSNEFKLLFFEAGHIPLNAQSYGAAQSLVRFLAKTSQKKFLEMIRKIKLGSTDAEALKSVYGMTHESLLRAWKRKIR